MSQSDPAIEEALPSKSMLPASLIRLLIPALLLGIGVWFSLQALRKNETAVSAPPPPSNQGPPPSKVVVAPVQWTRIQNTHRIVGSLRAAQRAEVAAREEGAVIEVLANEGDTVSRHDILVRLDPQRIEAQLAQAQANLTAARSTITQREAERERNATDLAVKKKLFQSEAISESEFLDAERTAKVTLSQEKAARDAVSAAAAALKLLEIRKNDLVIRAPFDASIATRHTEPGEWLRPGEPAMTLVSTGKLEAWLQVPERYATNLSSGTIEIEIGGRTFPAHNLRPVPEADPSSRVVTLIADIANPESGLVPGLSVTADVPVSDDTPRLSVPADAVVTTFAGPAVFRALSSDEGLPIAERIPVEILFQRGGLVFLKSPELSENDVVVIEGNERLFPQTPLLFEPPQPTAEQSAIMSTPPVAQTR